VVVKHDNYMLYMACYDRKERSRKLGGIQMKLSIEKEEKRRNILLWDTQVDHIDILDSKQAS